MYKLQLISKYLLKRRIAWVALVAVMLCTAMVLVVVSVMGGWLKSFEDSFHGMTGDVVVTGTSLGGFPQYDEMLKGIRELKDVEAAEPIIRTGALININGKVVEMVQVLGYTKNIGTVSDWPGNLHQPIEQRKKQLEELRKQAGLKPADIARLDLMIQKLPFSLLPGITYTNSSRHGGDATSRPAMIVSSSLLAIPRGNSDLAMERRDDMYHYPVSLILVPVRGGEPFNVSQLTPAAFWMVDDSKSQIWQLDNNNVYISFEDAQRFLGMAGADGAPPRCSEIEIKAKAGANLDTLRDQVNEITEKVRQKTDIPDYYDFKVQTWVQQQGAFIKAVKNEVVLTTVLFGIISMVAVLLIFCIFYMIVVEKTKDIGIIKSVGATGWGILSLFMGYGLAIGIVGATLGFTVAFVIVKYINQIHAWLGREMGIVIWSPETYQFEKIPDKMDIQTVVYVLLFAVLSALIGAFIPALRAASMNPVDALRYE